MHEAKPVYVAAHIFNATADCSMMSLFATPIGYSLETLKMNVVRHDVFYRDETYQY